MSRRRRVDEEPPDPEEPDEDDEDEEPVEYFDVDEDDDWVFTSVPNWAQESQTCISAPSIFTVLGDEVSAPHISHCGMHSRSPRRVIKRPTNGHRPVAYRRSSDPNAFIA